MNREKTSDIRVEAVVPLLAPAQLKADLPIGNASRATVLESRHTIGDILAGRDERVLAIVGPCSIHDPDAAIEYANGLKLLADELADVMVVVMRVYFEKPRTRLGWRGLILDPYLDGSYDIDNGLKTARDLLRRITALGLPAGSEMLDPIVPQYIDDLVSWASIGARTTESQTHREMASGLSMPVGFKNGTDGNEESALNAIASSLRPHSFIGIDQLGQTSVIRTAGNSEVFVILRGGRGGPNYFSWDTLRVEEMLRRNELPTNMIIDCNHGNSQKNAENQPAVLRDVIRQRVEGRFSIKGFMLESNINPGRQNLAAGVSELAYGVSVTDACLGWPATEDLLREAAGELRSRKKGGLEQ